MYCNPARWPAERASARQARARGVPHPAGHMRSVAVLRAASPAPAACPAPRRLWPTGRSCRGCQSGCCTPPGWGCSPRRAAAGRRPGRAHIRCKGSTGGQGEAMRASEGRPTAGRGPRRGSWRGSRHGQLSSDKGPRPAAGAGASWEPQLAQRARGHGLTDKRAEQGAQGDTAWPECGAQQVRSPARLQPAVVPLTCT